MQILEVLPNDGPGGMQITVERLVVGLRERGLDAQLAIGSRSTRDKAISKADLSFPELNLTPGNAARAAWRLRSIVRKRRPDVVHGHGLRMAPVLTFATASLRPVPLVVTCHGIPPEQVPRAARHLKISRAVVASCGEGPRALLSAEGLNGPLLRNGVPPPPVPSDRKALMRSWGLPGGLALVLSPGRLVPQKDHMTAIRAIQHLPAAALVIIGDGPLRVELQAEVDALGVGARVRLVSWRTDLRSVMGAADAVLLASRWEGFPLVAVEAMMASVPVVAVSSPGLREWLVHDDNALLSPVTNHSQLAESLRRVFEDRELRSRLIAGGGRTAERHTITMMLDDHIHLYNELVNKSARNYQRNSSSNGHRR
jgi:glycosyltransferase involved in cell wall biosynthesis